MLDLRPFDRLGTFANDWLDAHYHFSFADYHDPARMGLGALRVWNDDAIAAGGGFAPHSHRDMEIVTYVREGVLTHEDSLGHRGRIEAGQVQVMSAGTGIVHAEFNPDAQPVRLFQIWILPSARGFAPRWDTRPFPRQPDELQVMASGRPEDGALHINQDARVLAGLLTAGQRIAHPLAGRAAYLVPSRGRLRVNGIELTARSGLAVWDEPTLALEVVEDAELVVVEVAQSN